MVIMKKISYYLVHVNVSLVQRCSRDATHYDSMPMHYAAIFHSCKKKDSFQMKNCDIFIFAQNIDLGYTLEPPH